jgi:hypothetical protein
MDPIKSNCLNQIGPIIENQLYLSGRQRAAQHLRVGLQFFIRPVLVSILEQGHSSLSQ